MFKVLVAYTTYEGHTAKIAERITSTRTRRGLCGRGVRSGTHAAGGLDA